jgi:hypothetical protein
MATLVWTNGSIVVNSVDLTNHCRGITLNYASEMVEDTVFGASARTKKPGYKSWSVTAILEQDFGANSVDATLFPLVGNATAFNVAVKPDAGAQSPTNPTYFGNCVLESYQPMQGGVGELMVTNVTFQSAGALTRNAV